MASKPSSAISFRNEWEELYSFSDTKPTLDVIKEGLQRQASLLGKNLASIAAEQKQVTSIFKRDLNDVLPFNEIRDLKSALQEVVNSAKLAHEVYSLQLELNISKHACQAMHLELLEVKTSSQTKDDQIQALQLEVGQLKRELATKRQAMSGLIDETMSRLEQGQARCNVLENELKELQQANTQASDCSSLHDFWKVLRDETNARAERDRTQAQVPKAEGDAAGVLQGLDHADILATLRAVRRVLITQKKFSDISSAPSTAPVLPKKATAAVTVGAAAGSFMSCGNAEAAEGGAGGGEAVVEAASHSVLPATVQGAERQRKLEDGAGVGVGISAASTAGLKRPVSSGGSLPTRTGSPKKFRASLPRAPSLTEEGFVPVQKTHVPPGSLGQNIKLPTAGYSASKPPFSFSPLPAAPRSQSLSGGGAVGVTSGRPPAAPGPFVAGAANRLKDQQQQQQPQQQTLHRERKQLEQRQILQAHLREVLEGGSPLKLVDEPEMLSAQSSTASWPSEDDVDNESAAATMDGAAAAVGAATVNARSSNKNTTSTFNADTRILTLTNGNPKPGDAQKLGVAAMGSETASVLAATSDAAEVVAALQWELAVLQAELQKTQEQALSDLDSSKALVLDLKAQLSASQQKLAKTESAREPPVSSRLAAEAAANAIRIMDVERKLASANEAASQARQQLKQACAAKDSASLRLAEARSRLHSVQEEKGALEKAAAAAEARAAKAEALESEVQSLRASLESANKKAMEEELSATARIAELRSMSSAAAALEHEHEQERVRAAARVAALEKELEAERKSSREYEAMLTRLTDDVVKRERERERQQAEGVSQGRAQEKRREEAEEALRRCEGDLALLQEQYDGLLEEYETARQRLSQAMNLQTNATRLADELAVALDRLQVAEQEAEAALDQKVQAEKEHGVALQKLEHQLDGESRKREVERIEAQAARVSLLGEHEKRYAGWAEEVAALQGQIKRLEEETAAAKALAEATAAELAAVKLQAEETAKSSSTKLPASYVEGDAFPLGKLEEEEVIALEQARKKETSIEEKKLKVATKDEQDVHHRLSLSPALASTNFAAAELVSETVTTTLSTDGQSLSGSIQPTSPPEAVASAPLNIAYRTAECAGKAPKPEEVALEKEAHATVAVATTKKDEAVEVDDALSAESLSVLNESAAASLAAIKLYQSRVAALEAELSECQHEMAVLLSVAKRACQEALSRDIAEREGEWGRACAAEIGDKKVIPPPGGSSADELEGKSPKLDVEDAAAEEAEEEDEDGFVDVARDANKGGPPASTGAPFTIKRVGDDDEVRSSRVGQTGSAALGQSVPLGSRRAGEAGADGGLAWERSDQKASIHALLALIKDMTMRRTAEWRVGGGGKLDFVAGMAPLEDRDVDTLAAVLDPPTKARAVPLRLSGLTAVLNPESESQVSVKKASRASKGSSLDAAIQAISKTLGDRAEVEAKRRVQEKGRAAARAPAPGGFGGAGMRCAQEVEAATGNAGGAAEAKFSLSSLRVLQGQLEALLVQALDSVQEEKGNRERLANLQKTGKDWSAGHGFPVPYSSAAPLGLSVAPQRRASMAAYPSSRTTSFGAAPPPHVSADAEKALLSSRLPRPTHCYDVKPLDYGSSTRGSAVAVASLEANGLDSSRRLAFDASHTSSDVGGGHRSSPTGAGLSRPGPIGRPVALPVSEPVTTVRMGDGVSAAITPSETVARTFQSTVSSQPLRNMSMERTDRSTEADVLRGYSSPQRGIPRPDLPGSAAKPHGIQDPPLQAWGPGRTDPAEDAVDAVRLEGAKGRSEMQLHLQALEADASLSRSFLRSSSDAAPGFDLLSSSTLSPDSLYGRSDSRPRPTQLDTDFVPRHIKSAAVDRHHNQAFGANAAAAAAASGQADGGLSAAGFDDYGTSDTFGSGLYNFETGATGAEGSGASFSIAPGAGQYGFGGGPFSGLSLGAPNDGGAFGGSGDLSEDDPMYGLESLYDFRMPPLPAPPQFDEFINI